MGCPAPSSAAALTPLAPVRPRKTTVPETGSMREGDSPPVALVRVSFHFRPVFDTREPVVRSILPDRASGAPSIDDNTMLAKLFVTSTERFLSAFGFALTNPISACVRSVSTVTNPLYQASSLVSETIGLASTAAYVAVGAPS